VKEPTTDIAPENLVAEVTARKAKGWRLVTVTCVELDASTLDLIYHFDLDLQLEHLRMRVSKGATIPSISGVYFAAFLVENEMMDQFGLAFDGLVLSFGGKLYLEDDAQRTPFCRYDVVKKEAAPASGA